MKTLGYKNGYRYMTDGKDIFRNDYSDDIKMGVRWFSTVAGFEVFKRAHGCLYDARGNEAACPDCGNMAEHSWLTGKFDKNDEITICDACCKKMADRIDKAEHQNQCDW